MSSNSANPELQDISEKGNLQAQVMMYIWLPFLDPELQKIKKKRFILSCNVVTSTSGILLVIQFHMLFID